MRSNWHSGSPATITRIELPASPGGTLPK